MSNSALRTLFNAHETKRDDSWLRTFYDVIKKAKLFVPKTSSVGPDGFCYIDFILPDEDEDLNSPEMSTLNFLKDQIVDNDGYGVVIKSRDGRVNWVFSYGDMVHFYLNNTFEPIERSVNIKMGDDKLQEGAELTLAEPSENFLPLGARNALKEFFSRHNIKEPRVVLMTRKLESGETVQELAFVGQQYPIEVRDRIAWYFPRHYIIVIIPEVDSNFPTVML